MSPPYLPICGISLPFQVNLHVPPLKFSNKLLFLCAWLLMEWQEVVGIFHTKRVILRSSVYSLIIAREKSGKRDSQSRNQKLQINKQNSPRIDVYLDGTCGFGSPWSVIVGGGGVNLNFYRLGTTTNVFSMEDIDSWWSQIKQEGCISQNFIYLCFKNLSSGTVANHCFPLRRDFLFNFYVDSSPSIQAPDLRAILSFPCIVIIDVVC
jgi:hypothetical protein